MIVQLGERPPNLESFLSHQSTFLSGVHNCFLPGCSNAVQECLVYKSILCTKVHHENVLWREVQLCTGQSGASTFNDLILAVCAHLSRKTYNQIYMLVTLHLFLSSLTTEMSNVTFDSCKWTGFYLFHVFFGRGDLTLLE